MDNGNGGTEVNQHMLLSSFGIRDIEETTDVLMSTMVDGMTMALATHAENTSVNGSLWQFGETVTDFDATQFLFKFSC